MSKILDAIDNMGEWEITYTAPKTIDSKIKIKCSKCNKEFEVTIGAVYRQNKRGKKKYTCKSCAGTAAWTKEKKKKASNKAKKQWKDPNYAGTITGKALANEIRRITQDVDIEKHFLQE